MIVIGDFADLPNFIKLGLKFNFLILNLRLTYLLI